MKRTKTYANTPECLYVSVFWINENCTLTKSYTDKHRSAMLNADLYFKLQILYCIPDQQWKETEGIQKSWIHETKFHLWRNLSVSIDCSESMQRSTLLGAKLALVNKLSLYQISEIRRLSQQIPLLSQGCQLQIKAKYWNGHNEQILIDVQDYILRKINTIQNDSLSCRLCNKNIVWYVK